MAYLICSSKSLALVISNLSKSSSIAASQGKPLWEGPGSDAFCSGVMGSSDVQAIKYYIIRKLKGSNAVMIITHIAGMLLGIASWLLSLGMLLP